VLSGSGFVQRGGSPAEPIAPGDTVMIAPDERHWHGAGPDQLFVHLAMHESGPDGTDVVWAEAVAEDEYRQATTR
jgi:quercetin dioxygenase-like cupin family protein